MSRVGKNEILIPSGVTFSQQGEALCFKGKNEEKMYTLPRGINIQKTDAVCIIVPVEKTRDLVTLWGTTTRNIQNIIRGLSVGFSLNVDLVGVGYKAAVSGDTLTLQLGFSHDVLFPIPKGISIRCDKPTTIVISGSCKQHVGQVAAQLRTYRPPEPYKGKGVIRSGEFVLRKEGKKK